MARTPHKLKGKASANVIVEHKHAYTSEDVPWRMDYSGMDANGQVVLNGKPRAKGWRLFHYISAGGGMPQMGRSSKNELAALRQRTFVFALVVLGVMWLMFYFFIPCV